MGLFDFSKKKGNEPTPFEQPPLPPETGANHPPVEQVLAMQQQGLTPNQIVDSLQRAGFTSTQVMDALNQADAKRGVEASPPPSEMEGSYGGGGGQADSSYEQLAESIVNERWQVFSKELAKWSEWKEKTDSRIDHLDQSVIDLKNAVDTLHKALVGKIGDYDRNLMDVGTEIKAMERVFQKILPTLSENVNELSRITKQMKPAGK